MSGAPFNFTKLEGCGNDFVVARLEFGAPPPEAPAVRRLLDRNFGVGGDGLLLVRGGTAPEIEVLMFNPDGSRMGMCGNGIRCVVRFLALEGALRPAAPVEFVVQGRRIVCTYSDEGRVVRVGMGRPILEAGSIPVRTQEDPQNFEIAGGVRTFRAGAVSMGNPHCVIFQDDISSIDVTAIGSAIEKHPMFPERVNVEFVQVVGPDRLRVAVWERGAGITLACGTGACAAVVIGALSGKCKRSCAVELPGGELTVSWPDSGEVFLEGPAREIFTGKLLTFE